MKIFTACAIRADMLFGFDKQYVHFDTTSKSVYGDYLPGEGQEVPFSITYGYRPSESEAVTSGKLVWQPCVFQDLLPLGS
jgi:hypothetical protein